MNLLNQNPTNGIDTLAAYLAGALETIEHLEDAMRDVQNRVHSIQTESSGLNQRVATLERRGDPRKTIVGKYRGLDVRVLNEDRGVSEILFSDGRRTHVESSLVVKR